MLLCLCRFRKYFYWIYVKQCTSQLSVKATAFPRYLLKPTLFMLFKFDSCFFSCCSLTCLIFHKLPLSWHVSWHSQVVIILSEKKKKKHWIQLYLNMFRYLSQYLDICHKDHEIKKGKAFWTCFEECGLSCIRKPNFCSSLKGWYWSQISPDYKIREERCTQIRREVILTLSVVNRV